MKPQIETLLIIGAFCLSLTSLASSAVPDFSTSLSFTGPIEKPGLPERIKLKKNAGKCSLLVLRNATSRTASVDTEKCDRFFDSNRTILSRPAVPMSDFSVPGHLYGEIEFHGQRHWKASAELYPPEECDVDLNCKAPPVTPVRKLCLELIELAHDIPNIAAAEPPAHCQVTVRTTRASGEIDEQIFHLNLNSEADCKKAAKRHGINFNPKVIAEVQSSYLWEKREKEK